MNFVVRLHIRPVAGTGLGGCGLTPFGAAAYISLAVGRMAEWLCRGLQILVQRFDSASGLHAHKPFSCLQF